MSEPKMQLDTDTWVHPLLMAAWDAEMEVHRAVWAQDGNTAIDYLPNDEVDHLSLSRLLTIEKDAWDALNGVLAQVNELAEVLMHEFGGPTEVDVNGGAISMAIRVLREQKVTLAPDLHADLTQQLVDAGLPTELDELWDWLRASAVTVFGDGVQVHLYRQGSVTIASFNRIGRQYWRSSESHSTHRAVARLALALHAKAGGMEE